MRRAMRFYPRGMGGGKRAVELRISPNHCTMENFTERMTTAQWKAVLLAEVDKIFCKGHLRRLVAKRLGAGVVEVGKAPMANGNP